MSPREQPGHQPENPIEHALAAGIDAIQHELEARGLDAEETEIVVMVAGTTRVGDVNAATASSGVDGPEEMLALLLAQATRVGRAIGKTIVLAPLGRG